MSPGWWSRLRGRPLPPEAATGLADAVGARPRVLRWAVTDRGGLVVALPDLLALRAGPDREWELVGWHEIEHGSWNGPDRLLQWIRHDGRRGRLVLPEPERLPEVFTERVDATIVVQRDVTDEATGAEFTLVGRRRLPSGTGPDGPPELFWHVQLKRGTRASAPGVAEATAREMRALRAEYDISPHGC